jgi:D-sedoheptulose 7-phosphate isomerase
MKTIQEALDRSIKIKIAMRKNTSLLSAIERAQSEMCTIYRNGGKLLIAGNGGSAADAQHFAAEITCQYELERKGRPAIALTTDTSALTAWSNDYDYESVFSRLLEAHAGPKDALVVISTSGNSKNLIHAARTARQRGMKVFGLLGRDGGSLAPLCDHPIIIPAEETPRIQECHILIIHSLCSALDEFFANEDAKN